MKALGRFSKRFYLKQIIICIQVYLLVVLGPLCGSSALATPNNPNVVLGSTEPITTGNTTTVNLISEKAVINWQGLNTADGQRLEFDKSGASGAFFAVLNRVTGGGATQFNGSLEGHGGHVIIVNPNGIVFGSTAVVNAFKFTASGMGINSTDYTSWYNGSGQLKFTSGSGTVTNNGAITAQQVNLIGKSVTNNGTIRTTSPDGLVVMAAGDKVYLAETGSSVIVDTGSSASDNVARNAGTIDAPGGGILLAAGDIFSQAAIEDAGSFVAEADRDITIEAPIETTGNVTIWADKLGDTKGDVLAEAGADITAGGNVIIKGNEVKLYGAVKAGADEFGNVAPDQENGKDLTITGRDCFGGDDTEWRDVWAYSTLEAGRDIIISDTGETEIATWVSSGKCGGGHWEYSTDYEPGTIHLFGDVTAGRDLALYNSTFTGPDVTLRAGNNIILENDELETTPPGYCERLTGDTWLALRAGNEIKAPETVISVTGSTLIMEQGLSINLDNFNFDNQENTNLTLISNVGSVTAVDTGAKPENAADKWQSIGATAHDDITLSGDGSIRSGDSGTDGKSLWAINGDIDVDAGQDFSADKDIEAGSDVTVMAGDNILLMGNATAGQNITLDAVDDVEVQGDLVATSGNIEIYASEDTIYLWGDTTAGGNILLNTNTEFEGSDDQHVEAGGTITANGRLNKLNDESDGSLYLHANCDISLADFVQAASFEDNYGGGVSIISENGKIFTPDGLNNDTLNVPVTGRSVDTETEDVGVDLPYGSGKAAILIQSYETLKLGDGSELKACGTYDNTSADDRAGINFLDVDAEIPAGVPRDPGVAFDLAIYTASRTGSVEVDCPVTIASSTIPLPTIAISEIPEQEPGAGAMVVDAYDIVKLGEQFKESLAAGVVGDRLEVASRITEWLEDAVDRLPFPQDLDLPENYNYVMRGAGLENPEITDGRAWVLESKVQPFGEAAPIQEPVGLKLAGCPALMSWLAGELGVNAEQVQILFSSARGYTYDVQPCDTCARLQGAARILMDSDGSRIAALARVVNGYAAAGAPPSEEQMALIAAAMENPGEGSDFALASEWLDAMTEYVSILHNNFGLATEDAVATAGKYVSPVTTSDNTAVAGYVSSQLAEIGG